jgi:hypothetical protein
MHKPTSHKRPSFTVTNTKYANMQIKFPDFMLFVPYIFLII